MRAAGPLRSGRVVPPADLAGLLVCAVPLLLSVYLAAGIRQAETAIYAICMVAVLPFVAPFIASMRRNPANTAVLTVFVVLGVATLAASQQAGSDVVLSAKGLAATPGWASRYRFAVSTMRVRVQLPPV